MRSLGNNVGEVLGSYEKAQKSVDSLQQDNTVNDRLISVHNNVIAVQFGDNNPDGELAREMENLAGLSVGKNVDSLEDLQKEVDEIVDGINQGLRFVAEQTGMDAEDMEVADLEAGVAGQYDLLADRTKITMAALITVGAHVMLHEYLHRLNALNAVKKYGELVVVQDRQIDEALVEFGAKLRTGKQIAYQHCNPRLQALSARSGRSIHALYRLHEQGANQELNGLIAEAFNGEFKQVA